MEFQFKKMTFSHCVTFFMLFWLMNVLYVVPAIAKKYMLMENHLRFTK